MRSEKGAWHVTQDEKTGGYRTFVWIDKIWRNQGRNRKFNSSSSRPND